MRMPIKLSLESWPGWMTALLPSRADPGALLRETRAGSAARAGDARTSFSQRVSGLVEGGVWRSTAPGRHSHTHALIARIPPAERARVLEIGASDGVTALELVEALGGRYDRLWVTDRRLRVRYARRGDRLFFYGEDGGCLLVSDRRFLVYASPDGWVPFRWWARRMVASAPVIPADQLEELDLVQPELRALAERDARVLIREYDVARPWDGGPVDLIKVANLLNRAYFPDAVLRGMLVTLAGALREGGRLVVIDNRSGREHASVLLRTAGGFTLSARVGEGAEATAAAVALNLSGAVADMAPAPIEAISG